MSKGIRIYALLIGPSLPEKELEINGCLIKKMSFSEQRRRKFAPIKFEEKSKRLDGFDTFVTTTNIEHDNREIRTQYVISTDIESMRWEGAMNIAYSLFENVIQTLNIVGLEDQKFSNRTVTHFYSFDYQIVKFYELENGEETKEIGALKFRGGATQKINFPRQHLETIGIDAKKIKKITALIKNNEGLRASLEYLTYADRCLIFRLPPENTILNLVKAIEIILRSFKFKRGVKGFKKKLNALNNIFRLSSEEQNEIYKLWDIRSNDGVAHAPENLNYSHFYLSSIPTTKNKLYDNFWDSIHIVAKIIKRYAEFLDSLIIVKIEGYKDKSEKYPELIYVSNRGYHVFHSNERRLQKLVPELKSRISRDLGISYKNIKVYSHQQKTDFIFKVNDELFDRHTKRLSYILWG